MLKPIHTDARGLHEINAVVVHQSDSAWGDAQVIDRWHRQRGWAGIGYHYVILNGRRAATGRHERHLDGALELGRPVELVGAHCRGANRTSIGVCLIGVGSAYLTMAQVATLQRLLADLQQRFLIPITTPPDLSAGIHCHYQYPSAARQGKTCPGFGIKELLKVLRNGEEA